MMNDRFAELVPLKALGILPESMADEVRVHLRGCATCRAEYDALRGVGDLVGLAAVRPGADDAPATPSLLKARVLRAARAMREPRSMNAPAVPSDSAHMAGANAFLDFAPGIKWAVTRGDGVTLVLWTFDPPACGDIPDECHALTQSGIVLDGSFSLHYADGTSRRLSKQDIYTVAPGTVHGAEFHEPTVLFDVYTPNHTEFEERYFAQLQERDTTESGKGATRTPGRSRRRYISPTRRYRAA